MDNNTSARPCTNGAQTSRTAPWLPMPAALWPSIAASISGEWPRDAAIMDLRWWDDQVRMGREKRIPGRPRLIKRWGGGAWTDWAVKMLLRNEAAWKDPRHQKPPAHRQRTASAPPASKTIADVESQPTASAPPALRQPTATRADLHKNTTTQEHTPLKPPQGGRASDEATSNPQMTLDGSPVDNSDEAVDKSTETTTTPQKPKKRARKPDCLSVAEVIAVEIPAELASVEGYAEGFRQWCEVRPGKGWRQKPIQVERFHAKMLKAHRSGLDVIRGLGDAFDKGWKGISPSYLKPIETRPSGEQSRTNEAAPAEGWARVEEALKRFRGRPPNTGKSPWRFSDDTATDRAYMAGILAAAERPDVVSAWDVLWNSSAAYDDRTREARKWQRIRFSKTYKARRLRGAA